MQNTQKLSILLSLSCWLLEQLCSNYLTEGAASYTDYMHRFFSHEELHSAQVSGALLSIIKRHHYRFQGIVTYKMFMLN